MPKTPKKLDAPVVLRHQMRPIRTNTGDLAMSIAFTFPGQGSQAVGMGRDLADAFHSYYNAQKFLDGDTGLRNARLTLVAATRQVLANGLVDLLGISAPERM